MRLLDLVRGAAAGYALKALQTVAAVAVLPLLVSERALGLDGYGHSFALLSATAVMSVLTDGFKVALSRSIARHISQGGAGAGRMLGAGTRLLGLAAVGAAASLVVLCNPLLELMGLPVDRQHRAAYFAATSMIVTAECSHGLLALLLARGRLDVVNAVQAIEVVARNVFFVAYYSGHEATVSSFVGAFAVGAVLRTSAYAAYAAVRLRADIVGFTEGRLREAWPVLRYSFSVSLATIYYFLFFRLCVPFVNALLGGEAAGFLALALNISDTYLRGVLLSVVEPAIVPVVARLRPEDLDGPLGSAVIKIEALLRGACLVATAPIAAAAPFAIELWLGPELRPISLATQVMIAAIGLQLSLALQRSIAIGLGGAGRLAVVATPTAAVAILGIAVAAIVYRSWEGVAFSIAAFGVVCDAVGTTRAFAKTFGRMSIARPLRTILVALAIYTPAGVLGSAAAPRGLAAVGAAVVLSAGLALLFVHLLVVPLADAWATLGSMKRHASREVIP